MDERYPTEDLLNDFIDERDGETHLRFLDIKEDLYSHPDIIEKAACIDEVNENLVYERLEGATVAVLDREVREDRTESVVNMLEGAVGFYDQMQEEEFNDYLAAMRKRQQRL